MNGAFVQMIDSTEWIRFSLTLINLHFVSSASASLSVPKQLQPWFVIFVPQKIILCLVQICEDERDGQMWTVEHFRKCYLSLIRSKYLNPPQHSRAFLIRLVKLLQTIKSLSNQTTFIVSPQNLALSFYIPHPALCFTHVGRGLFSTCKGKTILENCKT